MLKIDSTIDKVSIHLSNINEYKFKSFNWVHSNSKMSKNLIYVEVKATNVLDKTEEVGMFLSFDQAIELRNILDDEIENVLQDFEKAVTKKLKDEIESDCNA